MTPCEKLQLFGPNFGRVCHSLIHFSEMWKGVSLLYPLSLVYPFLTLPRVCELRDVSRNATIAGGLVRHLNCTERECSNSPTTVMSRVSTLPLFTKLYHCTPTAHTRTLKPTASTSQELHHAQTPRTSMRSDLNMTDHGTTNSYSFSLQVWDRSSRL